MIDAQTAALLRQLQAKIGQQDAKIDQILATRPRSPTEEIDAIPGRRIMYNLVGSQTFTTSQDGTRGNPINMLISQDGPFIMTAYPIAMWKVSSPANATNFGMWRPVSMWPLPLQQIAAAGTLDDIISISYEMTDSGSQRNLQNLPLPPLLSTPESYLPLPVPTMFAPNTTIQFTPTYEDITFSGAGTATTGGTLVVALPGYRVVNM